MTDFIAYQGKMAGAALLLSIPAIVVGLIITILGKIGGLAAGFRAPQAWVGVLSGAR